MTDSYDFFVNSKLRFESPFTNFSSVSLIVVQITVKILKERIIDEI